VDGSYYGADPHVKAFAFGLCKVVDDFSHQIKDATEEVLIEISIECRSPVDQDIAESDVDVDMCMDGLLEDDEMEALVAQDAIKFISTRCIVTNTRWQQLSSGTLYKVICIAFCVLALLLSTVVTDATVDVLQLADVDIGDANLSIRIRTLRMVSCQLFSAWSVIVLSLPFVSTGMLREVLKSVAILAQAQHLGPLPTQTAPGSGSFSGPHHCCPLQ
jgi:hypothetical protein